MSRFAFFCPPYRGHLDPMLALARGLIARGHAATLVGQADVEARIRGSDVAFEAVGAATHPVGTLDRMEARLAATTGLLGIAGVIGDVARTTTMLCRDGVQALDRIGADGIVADQTEAAGGLLARHLGLPQVSVANALLINREPSIPPPFIGWRYDASDWGVKRNRGGYRIADLLMRPVGAVIRRVAAEWQLGPLGAIEDCLSPTLQISQTTESFDFPRQAEPETLVHVGPLRDREMQSFAPPDLRPLVFCSLGTLQGSRFRVFETVAGACKALDLSLVIAHGGKLSDRQVARLPGAPQVGAYWPQRGVLARAAAVVTHGGLNTVLDALSAGVPQIVVPIAFEQGAIAARVERSGAGLVLPLRRVTTGRLTATLERLLETSAFGHQAHLLKRESERAGGVDRAVDLIEAAVAGPRYRISS